MSIYNLGIKINVPAVTKVSKKKFLQAEISGCTVHTLFVLAWVGPPPHVSSSAPIT